MALLVGSRSNSSLISRPVVSDAANASMRSIASSSTTIRGSLSLRRASSSTRPRSSVRASLWRAIPYSHALAGRARA